METCTLSRTRYGLDRAPVFLNDPVRHRKTEPGAFPGRFGGEERIVNAAQMFGRDAMPGIAHLNSHAAFAVVRGHLEHAPRSLLLAAELHGVPCIHEEIQKYLLQFAGIA